MSDEAEKKTERSRISVRIDEFQVELEGTYDNIKKLMSKELFDFTKGLQETRKQLPSSTEITPEVTPTPKEKTVPPPSKPSATSEALSQPSRVSTIGKTTDKGGQKKIVSRTMVIALGMVCIVLAAGLVGAIAFYLPMVSSLESQIAQQDNTILSLNSQISSLTSQVSSLNSQVLSLQSSLNQSNNSLVSLEEVLLYYRSIVYLNETMSLFATQAVIQDANTSTTVFNGSIYYAGYVSVGVVSSSNTTYAQVVYSYHGVNYNHTETVGTSGTASFPVLPGEIEIRIGNTEPVENVTATVSATYYY